MPNKQTLLKTGVIGLGTMGSGMALNLRRQGALTATWNRTRSRIEQLASQQQLPLVDDLFELARQTELIITCVSRDNDLLEVLEQLLPAINRRHILLDTSTVSVETAQEAARRLADKGAAFIDGPVSGGREGASNGTLVMMAGGDPGTLDRLRPTLAAFTSSVAHMGPVGAGQATKAVNQIMAAGINQAVSEALAFGQSLGLHMEQVIDVIGSGAAGNWFLQHRGKSMLAGQFDPGFKLALHHKDLEICQQMAEAQGVHSPVVEMTLRDYRKLLAEGHGDEDISTLFRKKQQLYRHE